MPRHHLNAHPTKELLRLGYIPKSHEQNNFGRIWVVAPWQAPLQQVPKMRLYVLGLSTRSRVIRVQRLCDARVVSSKIPIEGEYPYAICYHGEGVPLGHTLFAVQEVT